MHRANNRRLGWTVALAATALLAWSTAASSARAVLEPQTVVDVEFLGEVVVPTGTDFAGTEVGGLSSITYDEGRGVYHTLSDDQGNRPTGDPVRYYTVDIDLSDGSFDDGDLEFVGVAQLFETKKTPFAPGGLDPEGFALARGGYFFMSSEGNTLANPIIDPFIRRYNRKRPGHRESSDTGPLRPERGRSRRQVQPCVREPERHAERPTPRHRWRGRFVPGRARLNLHEQQHGPDSSIRRANTVADRRVRV